MQVTINGQVETVAETLSVAQLLTNRKLQSRQVAVELNEEIVRRTAQHDTLIQEGDRIEIVTFVGGG